MNINEYLQNLIKDMDNLYLTEKDNFYEEVDFNEEIISYDLLCSLIDIMEINEKTEMFWDMIMMYIPEEIIDDKLFDFFIKNNIAISSLGHKNLDNKKLKKLAPYVIESVITLLKRYYCEKKYTNEDFAREIKVYLNDEVVIQLLNAKSSSTEKKKILFYCCKKYSSKLSDDVINLVNDLITADELYITENCNKIVQAYDKNNYIYNCAISCNLNTPNHILDKLKNIKNIKYAKFIRESAASTIKLKETIEKDQ